jgi:hypothetical protein
MATGHPLIWRQQVMAAKAETAAGTAVSLAAAEAVFNAFEVSVESGIQINERESQGSLSHLPGVPGVKSATVNATHEIANSGSATPPQWFSVVLPACGFGVSSLTATIQSGSSSAVTNTFGHYVDGLLLSAAGVMYDYTMTFEVGKVPLLRTTGQGVWQTPTDTALLTPTYPTANPPVFQGTTTTVGGTALKIARCVINGGNELFVREDANSATGLLACCITNRKPRLELSVEASLLTTYNPYTIHAAMTEAAFSLAIGSGSNGVVTVTAPKIQHYDVPKLVNRNGIAYWDFLYGLNKNAAAGDDELTIVLS